MNEIQNLQPQCIWKNFYALTQVPRPSGHLEKIQQFLLDFGKQAGVYAVKDPAGNIHFRKPATPGMENKKGIILQAHMDMVPQKTPESTHNFETDPIEPWIDGEWVKAKGTTLGADNGLGVAAIMAIMEDKTLKHGPIDALVTRDEETGMFGANELPEGELQGDILMNLDSEHWGKFVIDGEEPAWRTLWSGNQRGSRQCQQVAGAGSPRGHRRDRGPSGQLERWQHAQCHPLQG